MAGMRGLRRLAGPDICRRRAGSTQQIREECLQISPLPPPGMWAILVTTCLRETPWASQLSQRVSSAFVGGSIQLEE